MAALDAAFWVHSALAAIVWQAEQPGGLAEVLKLIVKQKLGSTRFSLRAYHNLRTASHVSVLLCGL
jgi:hypothetical protein